MTSDNKDIPVTNDSLGEPISGKNQVLTAGAAVTQVCEAWCHGGREQG